MTTTSLDKLEINKFAKISALNCNGDLRRRLLDLGLIHGTTIKAILKSPMGNPIAYEVRGTTIALRKEDSKFISVWI
ncbi:MAG: ferrous iron transport protein A [Clostridia bacterium]|nr:ferrous iron transport protein A [Clostridia bacterium]